MFKIGPKLNTNIKQQSCCNDKCCHHCCSTQIESDKFDKVPVDKPSLKKVLPVCVISGLAGAGAVLGANALINKITKSKTGLATVLAVVAGFGVANTVMTQSFAKGKQNPDVSKH